MNWLLFESGCMKGCWGWACWGKKKNGVLRKKWGGVVEIVWCEF